MANQHNIHSVVVFNDKSIHILRVPSKMRPITMDTEKEVGQELKKFKDMVFPRNPKSVYNDIGNNYDFYRKLGCYMAFSACQTKSKVVYSSMSNRVAFMRTKPEIDKFHCIINNEGEYLHDLNLCNKKYITDIVAKEIGHGKQKIYFDGF